MEFLVELPAFLPFWFSNSLAKPILLFSARNLPLFQLVRSSELQKVLYNLNGFILPFLDNITLQDRHLISWIQNLYLKTDILVYEAAALCIRHKQITENFIKFISKILAINSSIETESRWCVSIIESHEIEVIHLVLLNRVEC